MLIMTKCCFVIHRCDIIQRVVNFINVSIPSILLEIALGLLIIQVDMENVFKSLGMIDDGILPRNLLHQISS